ncbi:KIN14I [Scenedesmus sp. PABB004]|nr:KIN14I [Scenedesmus sp. PABB004]
MPVEASPMPVSRAPARPGRGAERQLPRAAVILPRGGERQAAAGPGAARRGARACAAAAARRDTAAASRGAALTRRPGPQDDRAETPEHDWAKAEGSEPGFLTPQPARRLQSLSGHEESFQVDSFNRALQRTSTAGKLTALFKSKMMLSRASLGAGASPAAPARSPGGSSGGGAPPLSADELLQWSNVRAASAPAPPAAPRARAGGRPAASPRVPAPRAQEPIPTSLLRLVPEHAGRAVKMFAGILRYCGDAPGAEPLGQAAAIETAQKLLHQGLKRPELRDELYMQLVKQTRGNPAPGSRARAWGLFRLVASAMPPSKDFTALISEYVHSAVQDMDDAEEAKAAAAATWAALKRSTKCGPRRTVSAASAAQGGARGRQPRARPPARPPRGAGAHAPAGRVARACGAAQLPSVEEIAAHLAGGRLSTLVFFLDETFEEVAYDITTSVAEAVEALAGLIRLANYGTFTLYEALRPLGGKAAGAPEALPDEHLLLDEHRYIADIVAELRHPRAAREGCQSRLLFKKRMETDEAITEPQFIALSYVQAQHDYLAGNYPVVREDAAQMAALQIHAEHGPGLEADPDALLAGVERYVTRQVLMTRRATSGAPTYKALCQHSKEDARTQFMRILRTLPYGNATFFAVRRIEDPIGLLPPRLILGINKRGVHFFRPVPKEYLHSAELRDIMQFGSSSQAVFFKMRVAGVLHIFQFETRQGEDVCMALQTHINDIMMKRYSKVKAAGDARASSDGGAGGGGSAAYSAKMEEHLKEQAAQLERAEAALAAAQQAEGAARVENEALLSELADLRELMAGEAASRAGLQDALQAAQQQLGEMRNELDMTKSALTAASSLATEHSGRAEVEYARLAELEGLLEAKHRELEEAQARTAAAQRACEGAAAERDLLERKVTRLERSKESEAKELRDAYEASAAELRGQLKARSERLAELMEAAAHSAAQLEELRGEVQAARAEAAELEELRELKRDVERKERQQAAIIENQARRLEELDRLYREEVVARKRAHNALQDAKGKIRVYCRLRPMLDFEAAKKQVPAISVPNELTVAHAWKDEKKPREYDFDAVFGPQAGQDEVFAEARHLMRSALDGYNVCVFAYGQTGSGKTHTIYGTPAAPGLTPRGVGELFGLIEADAGKASYSVRLQMLELYQDTLMDLLLPEPAGRAPRGPRAPEAPRLEIKRDPKGVVTVAGATDLHVSSAAQLLAAVEQGLARRHTSSTAMNRESSRSHLVISCLLEGVNLQSQAVTRGKLSFVDLAGSERVKKSGSTGECLKEAQAINKSLSALGDVISALAAEQPHIPYRNHKLTMLMSDCLGGNAKALMFVNVSPTDANLDESANSLVYATRVRTIKNSAARDEANKEVLRLRKQVDYWKEQAGLATAEAKAAADLAEIDNRRCDSPAALSAPGGGGGGAVAEEPAGGSRPSTAAGRAAAAALQAAAAPAAAPAIGDDRDSQDGSSACGSEP